MDGHGTKVPLSVVAVRYEDSSGRAFLLTQENLDSLLSSGPKLVMDTLNRVSQTTIRGVTSAVIWLGTGPSVLSPAPEAKSVQLCWEQGGTLARLTGMVGMLEELHRVAENAV